MATCVLLLSLWTYIAHVMSQDFNYKNFTSLGIPLPTTLQQHISAVYNNKLYVFGGKNSTIFTITFSTLYWSLDLSQINLVLSSSKDDIDPTQLNTAVQWEPLSIAHPSYGPSSDGVMRCLHQCSVLVDHYLYIVAPYGSSDAYTSAVYRLDLSLPTPVFSAENDFPSSLPLNLKEPCITSSHDESYLYLVGGDQPNAGGEADDIFMQYNLSAHEWSVLPSMNQKRQSAGCAVSYNDAEVYIFGGKSEAFLGQKTIDTFNVDAGEWTNNEAISISPELPQPTFDIKCVSNVYDATVICPGGIAQRAYDTAIIYRTPNKQILDTVLLSLDTSAYGTGMYEFVNNGNDQATVLLLTGGHDGDLNVYDTIQYLVMYNVPTQTPTAAPSSTPTAAPSRAPTAPPTSAPSQAPTESPSIAPSESPTEPQSTEHVTQQGTAAEKQTEVYGQDPSKASRYSMAVVIFTCIVVFVLY